MKIIQYNNSSLNGFIARKDGREDWLPNEGWDEFVNSAQEFGNFIMGRETFEIVTKIDPDYNFEEADVPYKIIVTTNPDYAAPEGYIVAHSPQEARSFLAEKNVETGLLIGGGKLNGAFYANKLVDETWIMVNPCILGEGRPLIANSDFETKLKLIDVVRCSKDRVLLEYSVVQQ